MKAALALLALLAACKADAKPAEAGPDEAPAARPAKHPAKRPAKPKAISKLVEVERYARLAVPVAFTADGAHWVGGADYDLVEYDGEREVRRFQGSASVRGGHLLRALPDGGWIAGASRIAADGSTRWSGHAWAQQYG